MSYFIAILIFLLAGVIYDNFSPLYCYSENDLLGITCTNWSIFYFSLVYGAFLVITITRYIETREKIERQYMFIGGVMLFACIIRELTLLNMPYDTYAKTINSPQSKLVGIIYLTGCSLLITTNTIISWAKKLKKD